MPLYMGVAEAAELYEMTPQAINNRRNRGTMPEPVATLRMGHIWLAEDLISHRRLLEQQGRVFRNPLPEEDR